MSRKPAHTRLAVCASIAAGALCTLSPAAGAERGTWSFAVSGDSRNCGDLVMPAIAAAVKQDGAAFYWHLGDYRKISKPDEDLLAEARFSPPASPPTLEEYRQMALADAIQHQVQAFAPVPFFPGIGNHETIPPSSRDQFRTQMRPYLDSEVLKRQRQKDGDSGDGSPDSLPPTYFHWRHGVVDLINLDNATDDAFDERQTAWFDRVLAAAVTDRHVRTIVVGMHEALPHSLADQHSMCATAEGATSGERVYRALARAQKRGKHVYVLASHSHFLLTNIFATPYWQDTGHGAAVLPGWIVGTAGAERYALPQGVTSGPDAMTHVYGYLRGVAHADGRIDFAFHEITEDDLRHSRPADLPESLVTFCSEGNPPLPMRVRPVTATACDAERAGHDQ